MEEKHKNLIPIYKQKIFRKVITVLGSAALIGVAVGASAA